MVSMPEPEDRRGDRALSRDELRPTKTSRAEFATRARKPMTVVLDPVRQNYNIGAIFRLCYSFLNERLVIAGAMVT